MILLPKFGLEKPRSVTAINRGLAERHGAIWLSVANTGLLLHDLISGRNIASPGSVVPSQEGPAIAYNGSQQTNLAFTLPGGTSADNYVIAARIRATATQAASPGAAFGLYAAASGQTGIGVGFDTANAVGSAYLHGNGAGLAARSAGSLNTWYTVFVAANLQGGANYAHRAWINGTAATTDQGTIQIGGVSALDEIAVGAQHRSAGFLRQFTGQIAWASILYLPNGNSAFTDDSARQLFRSGYPYNLFSRRIWVPVSAAGASLALSASPLSIAGTVSASGDLAYETALALSASPLALSGTLSTTGDLTITPAATLALSASPLAIAGTLATAGELDYLLPTLALSASPVAITGTLAPTGDLAYELPTLALSASPLALSGTLTPSGDVDYKLPFALTASALAVSGTVSVSGDLSITDEIKLTLSASPLALAGALAVAGDLDYVVPTLVLSASPLALSGAVAVTGDPAAVVPFALTASPITLTGAVDVTGEIGVGTRFDITADPIVVTGALGVSGEILASFTVAQPLSAAPTGRRVQTSGGRLNVQTTRRPTYRGGTR